MPFLGKDWRSSGDEWVRTELGWERTKVLECILDNLNTGLRNGNKSTKRTCNSSTSTNEDDNQNSITDSILSDDENDEFEDDDLGLFSDDEDNEITDDDETAEMKKLKRNKFSFSKLSISTSSISDRTYSKPKQPHIIYFNFDTTNREKNGPKASVSEVLNALDMPGAVKDIKRFNYVCRLVQLIINKKLNELSGNAQRTLFLIVKQMLLQVIKTQENLSVMRKLLFDFKKKIQDSYYFYFYYIGSQTLGDRHLAIINKWQQMLENPNSFKRVKRLNVNKSKQQTTAATNTDETSNDKENNNASSSEVGFENIPFDCKLEIMRRLNTGLDLVNLSKCNKGLNQIITKEIAIWKNLCQFHFQQANINVLLNKQFKSNSNSKNEISNDKNEPNEHDLDWKLIYFKLKRRYGHREVYADMIHKCFHCKSLFWKEIGHPCIIAVNMRDEDIRTEPITPLKLVELLLK